jgi:hypothetical protein
VQRVLDVDLDFFVEPPVYWPPADTRPSVDDGAVAFAGRGSGTVLQMTSSSAFAGYRFPPEVITVSVRWYLRYGLSYRDLEELLAEPGVTVDHVTVYRWVQRFTTEFIEAARPCPRLPGDRWSIDET